MLLVPSSLPRRSMLLHQKNHIIWLVIDVFYSPLDVVGVEFHYLCSCSYFEDERNLILKPYYRVNPSTLRMKELFN